MLLAVFVTVVLVLVVIKYYCAHRDYDDYEKDDDNKNSDKDRKNSKDNKNGNKSDKDRKNGSKDGGETKNGKSSSSSDDKSSGKDYYDVGCSKNDGAAIVNRARKLCRNGSTPSAALPEAIKGKNTNCFNSFKILTLVGQACKTAYAQSNKKGQERGDKDVCSGLGSEWRACPSSVLKNSKPCSKIGTKTCCNTKGENCVDWHSDNEREFDCRRVKKKDKCRTKASPDGDSKYCHKRGNKCCTQPNYYNGQREDCVDQATNNDQPPPAPEPAPTEAESSVAGAPSWLVLQIGENNQSIDKS